MSRKTWLSEWVTRFTYCWRKVGEQVGRRCRLDPATCRPHLQPPPAPPSFHLPAPASPRRSPLSRRSDVKSARRPAEDSWHRLSPAGGGEAVVVFVAGAAVHTPCPLLEATSLLCRTMGPQRRRPWSKAPVCCNLYIVPTPCCAHWTGPSASGFREDATVLLCYRRGPLFIPLTIQTRNYQIRQNIYSEPKVCRL